MKHIANKEKDFGQGSVADNILRLAIPMTLAQLINVLYNVVDRAYIGHIPGTSTDALTGIGLTLPVITIITAFANLFGMGGSPLFSIARGADEPEKAEKIMGNCFSMLLLSGIVLSVTSTMRRETTDRFRRITMSGGGMRMSTCLNLRRISSQSWQRRTSRFI